MQEIWKTYREKTINAYHNQSKSKIEVSNLGRVKRNGELVDLSKLKSLYYSVGGINVHRMVAELFIPNPNNKPFVDHINTDTHDNRDVNLRWVTPKENRNNKLTQEHQSKTQKVAQNRLETNRKRSEKMIEYYKNNDHPRGMKGKTPWNKGLKIKKSI